jgi:hypothetical protein
MLLLESVIKKNEEYAESLGIKPYQYTPTEEKKAFYVKEYDGRIRAVTVCKVTEDYVTMTYKNGEKKDVSDLYFESVVLDALIAIKKDRT